MPSNKFGSIGIEIEDSSILSLRINGNHDASVESEIYYKHNRVTRLGTEIISYPFYTYSAMAEWVNDTINKLIAEGANENTWRDSIHIHIGFPATNIEFLKKTLLWAQKIDPHLFRLGSARREHRGFKNDFLYTRPLCSPQIVKTRNGYGKCFIVNDLLKVKTERGFWTRYGDSLNLTGRYVAQRYVGVNFYSLRRHGTLEFRHFNKTLNAAFIISLAVFLSKSVIKIVSSPYSTIEKLETFWDFVKFVELTPQQEAILMITYEKSPPFPYEKICKDNILSHLTYRDRLPTYWVGTKYVSPVILKPFIKNPIISDSHNREYNIYLGGNN